MRPIDLHVRHSTIIAHNQPNPPAIISPDTRLNASAVALIGPAIKQQADMTVDPVAVKLDANLVAHAIAAADTQNT
jgi:hypothetical protein